MAVIFGSRSVEHEISIITACQAMPLLGRLGAEVVPLYITKQGRWLTRPEFSDLETFREQLPEQGSPVQLDLDQGRLLAGGVSRLGRPRDLGVDVLFPCLHGTFGEDGSLAGLAELARIPQVGSASLASALAMDKFRSKLLFQAAGLPVLPARLAASPEGARAAVLELGYPLMVKPNRGGSSIGVSLVVGDAELDEALGLALTFDSAALLEPALLRSSDLNCAVKSADPRATEVERPIRAAGFLSYQDKYVTKGQLGSSKTAPTGVGGAKAGYPDPRRELPARIPSATRDQVQRLARAASDALGCAGSARVDFLLSESGDLYLNEVNTIPGSLAFHLWEASGVPFPDLLEELVREAIGRRESRQLALEDNLLAPHHLLRKASG